MALAHFARRLTCLASEDLQALRDARFDSYIVLGNVTDSQLSHALGNYSDDVRRLVVISRALCDGEERFAEIAEPPPTQALPVAQIPRVVASLARKPLPLPKKRPWIARRGAASSSVAPLEPPKEVSAATQQALDLLWSPFISLGALGMIWNDRLNTELGQEEYKPLLQEDLAKASSVAQHARILLEWIEYTETRGLNWRTPDSLAVRAFIRSFIERGPNCA